MRLVGEERTVRVLIACEESQIVCKAFRELGFEAYSCDLQECSGGHPEWHIVDDAVRILNPSIIAIPDKVAGIGFFTMDGKQHLLRGGWDLIIAHPPCTYLSNAGARWLYPGGKLNETRYRKGLDGKEFFMKFIYADCPRIAVENPIPSSAYKMPPCTQIIQPYEYGEAWSKKTCLWLKGLPLLQPTDIVEDHRPYISSGSYSRGHDPRYKGASRQGGSAKSRSKTFPGVARAMAEQWGRDWIYPQLSNCEMRGDSCA